MKEIDFEEPKEERHYRLFCDAIEENPSVLFHGTDEDCANSICENGFNPTGNLQSSSFSKNSGVALGFACLKRSKETRGAVLAVKFEDIYIRGIREEGDVVYLDNHHIQPEIVAICYIPSDYRFN